MPTKAKVDAIGTLAAAMLQRLEQLRTRGGEAYPPRLRQLALELDESPSDAQVQQAAGKKAFTARATVVEKVDRKPSLDSPVYFKEDVPPKPRARRTATSGGKGKKGPDLAPLAERMAAVLESQRRLGSEGYPPTLRRLAELSEIEGGDDLAVKVAGHAAMKQQAVVAGKGKEAIDSPVILRLDLQDRLPRVLPGLLGFALRPTTSTEKGKPVRTTAFGPPELKGRLAQELEKPVLETLAQATDLGGLPGDVGCVLVKGKPLYFLATSWQAARPGPPVERRETTVTLTAQVGRAVPSVGDPCPVFADDFRQAFERLDRRNGLRNFVTLADLRRELAGYTREAFDAGLRTLRLEGAFALNSHEGLHGTLTPEQREAGILEAGSLLVYASRR